MPRANKSMKTGAKAPAGGYTYREYCSWPEEMRCELIDGEVYDMTPSPSPLHQEISGEIFATLHAYFKGKTCKLYAAPLDIRMPTADEADEKVKTVVQPDLFVICDKKRIDAKGCRGAPDLAVEILSPSTSSKDRVKKLNLYERHGVREFWIVDPSDATVMCFSLNSERRYGRPMILDREMTLDSVLFPGLSIKLSDIFPPPPPSVRQPAPKFG